MWEQLIVLWRTLFYGEGQYQYYINALNEFNEFKKSYDGTLWLDYILLYLRTYIGEIMTILTFILLITILVFSIWKIVKFFTN